ncbi:hypothetical protein Leryth_012130 [Lithospermum erythrorhizon]|nr:hypothetical protein Leryth_012130 [Lithospermum erythrorhizon]
MGESMAKFVVVGFVVLSCFVIIIVFFLLLYIKWFWSDCREGGTTTHATPSTLRRRRFDFSGGHEESVVVPMHNRGLEVSILESLPSVVFTNKDFEEQLECSVCLCVFSDGETTRILPTCNHEFHMECIDMWFLSHSTCPLCRSPVSSPTKSSDFGSRTMVVHDEVHHIFPNNV